MTNVPVFRRLLLGAAAGAAGTTALHAVTYLDMAIRARPASRTPQQTVEKMAEAQHIRIPGVGAERENRLTGIASLSGIATGVGVGATYGLLDVLHLRPRGLLGTLLVGGGAMALSNSTMARYDVTHPGRWTMTDWASDIVPHLAFGFVVSRSYDAATGG